MDFKKDSSPFRKSTYNSDVGDYKDGIKQFRIKKVTRDFWMILAKKQDGDFYTLNQDRDTLKECKELVNFLYG